MSSMSNRSFCDTSGMLLAAMVVYVGSLLPAVALGDQQNVRADERAGTTGPPLAVEPFDAATAKGHQEAWAKHLGVPVEMTNSIGMKMVLIPPGEFVMGSPENEEGRCIGWIKEFEEKPNRIGGSQPEKSAVACFFWTRGFRCGTYKRSQG